MILKDHEDASPQQNKIIVLADHEKHIDEILNLQPWSKGLRTNDFLKNLNNSSDKSPKITQQPSEIDEEMASKVEEGVRTSSYYGIDSP